MVLEVRLRQAFERAFGYDIVFRHNTNIRIGEIMGEITLYSDCNIDATLVSNKFIDEYMKDANDAQIKIYLYLLRCMSANSPISVSIIADCFNYTEKDVIRALKYWEKNKILSLDFDASKNLAGIRIHDLNSSQKPAASDAPVAVLVEKPVLLQKDNIFQMPAKPNYSIDKLAAFKSKEDISQLLFIAEQYIGKTLSSTEISSLLYMYDSLGFSAELIEYLIEYCVNNKKKSMRYMETVALAWAESGITTVDEAKENVGMYRKEIYEILKALGLSGRNPVEPEMVFIKKWIDVYGFDTPIIIEACNRTMKSTHKSSFEYVDSILKSWKQSNVRHYSDIQALDDKFKSTKAQASAASNAKDSNASSVGVGNKFNNFNQRSYDFSELEKEILSN